MKSNAIKDLRLGRIENSIMCQRTLFEEYKGTSSTGACLEIGVAKLELAFIKQNERNNVTGNLSEKQNSSCSGEFSAVI